MGIGQRSFRAHLPGGPAWRLATTFRAVIDALGLAFDRMREFITVEIIKESLPSTAEDTLSDWFTMLGIPYDSTQTLATRRARAKQAWTATGGQSLDYLNGIIQIAFPDVEIQGVFGYYPTEYMVGIGMVGQMQVTDYPSWLSPAPTDGSYPFAYYRVIGEVPDTSDLNRILGLLDRIAPAEMEPVLDITVTNLTPTAEAGLGMVGLAQVGRTKEDT